VVVGGWVGGEGYCENYVFAGHHEVIGDLPGALFISQCISMHVVSLESPPNIKKWVF
jgi:hypothetical protein